MRFRKKRKLFRPSCNSNWTNITKTAICPSCLDSSASLLKCLAKTNGKINVTESFKAFASYVETQRVPVHKNETGSRSLQNISLDVVLRKLSQIHDIGDFPKHLSRRVWDMLNKRFVVLLKVPVAFQLNELLRCQVSFHSWKILSEALHSEAEATLAMFQYRETISHPSSPLHIYCDPLTSMSFNFIAALSITVQFPVASLVKLADMRNLGVLEIAGTPTIEMSNNQRIVSSVGDILIRAWSREAVEHGCFRVLRILRLWNHQELTEISLQYLPTFPALGIFDIRGCGIYDGKRAARLAEELGWKTIQQREELNELEMDFLGRSQDSQNDSMASREMRRISNEPLWDGSLVHRINRSIVKENLSHPQITSGQNFTDLTRRVQKCSDQKWREYVNDIAAEDVPWTSLSWDLFCATRDIKRWNSANAASWVRLGLIRNDSDLIRAGVSDTGKQAFVGKYFVSPVPMAYICLGESEILHSAYPAKLDETQDPPAADVIFIRTDDNSQNPKGRNVVKVEAKPVRQLKKGKRRIGNILHEFTQG